MESGLPAPDEEYRLAHVLLGKKNPLDRDILVALVGRPRRFAELQPLLQGRGKNNLTVALDRLRRDGLIDQRIEAQDTPPVARYELTALGIQVIFRMNQMLPAHHAAEVLRRAVQSES